MKRAPNGTTEADSLRKARYLTALLYDKLSNRTIKYTLEETAEFRRFFTPYKPAAMIGLLSAIPDLYLRELMRRIIRDQCGIELDAESVRAAQYQAGIPPTVFQLVVKRELL